MLSTSLLAIALSTTAVLASPFTTFPLVPRQGPNQCRNQSCEIATVAGSTGATVYPYSSYPTGDSNDGDCCIIRYFPAVKQEIYANRPNLQTYCSIFGGDAPLDSNPPGVNSVSVRQRAVKRDTTATSPCKPNILIFAKGTFEPGDLGITVGPSLQSGLDSSKWQVIGVNYDNSYSNDLCLGLPGGVTARQSINQVATTCPNSAIALAGYSQGAMVIRNAIARAPAAQVAMISNVVTFGDPFCGAPIGQYSGPLNVFCDASDGVCTGNFDISAAHLSYGSSSGPAVAILTSSEKQSL